MIFVKKEFNNAIKAIALLSILLGNYLIAGDQLAYGDTIRLKHHNTKRYLTALGKKYNNPGSSGQFAIAATNNQSLQDTLWLIEAGVDVDDIAKTARDGQVINKGDTVSLKSVGQNYHLHSHGGIQSPASGQEEVSGFLPEWGDKNQGDGNDNWTFLEDPIDGGVIQLKHLRTGLNLHSHDAHQSGGKLYIFGDDSKQ